MVIMNSTGGPVELALTKFDFICAIADEKRAYKKGILDYLYSLISGQCSTVEEDCQSIRCQHQGTCALGPMGSETNIQAVCHCPLGFEGKFCENAIEIEVCNFQFPSNSPPIGFGLFVQITWKTADC